MFKRIQDVININVEQVERELALNDRVVIQFSSECYDYKSLSKLNELLSVFDYNVQVRFYSHDFNMNHLPLLSNIKSLKIDCAEVYGEVESLGDLSELNELWFDVMRYKGSDILEFEPLRGIERLTIGCEKQRFDLDNLTKYTKLNYLHIIGKQKNIEAIRKIETLKTIRFHSLRNIDVSFLSEMNNLEELSFILGGIKSLESFSSNTLQCLEIIMVRGLEELGDISRFESIKSIHIEDEPNINTITISDKLESLKSLRIINCKNLRKIEGYKNLSYIESISISKTSLEFDSIFNNYVFSNLKDIYFGVGRVKVDNVIRERLIGMGYNAR